MRIRDNNKKQNLRSAVILKVLFLYHQLCTSIRKSTSAFTITFFLYSCLVLDGNANCKKNDKNNREKKSDVE